MNREARFDVIVFGGGPAGATVARCLAALGHSVCIVQREQRAGPPHPRWETLSPGALELLRLHHRVAWPAIERLLVPCRATVLWTRDDVRSPGVHRAALVDRRALDPILRASAAAAGAVAIHHGPFPPSQIVVDAGGRSPAFPATRTLLGPRTLVLTAWVAGSTLPPRSTHVESLADGWLWAGRGDEAETAVTLFLSLRTVRAWPRGDHQVRFLEMLRCSSRSPAGLASCVVSSIAVRDATPAERTPLADANLIRAGDAALALDPLSGQGLQRALVSAAQTATVLHTMLAREESAALAREFIQMRHTEAAQEHASACGTFYQRQDRFEGGFWRERANEFALPPAEPAPETLEPRMREPLILSETARWKDVPVLAGEFIEKARALQHPSLARPIAYLEGRSAAELLAGFSGGITGLALVRQWASRAELPEEAGIRALRLLLRHGVLLPTRIAARRGHAVATSR